MIQQLNLSSATQISTCEVPGNLMNHLFRRYLHSEHVALPWNWNFLRSFAVFRIIIVLWMFIDLNTVSWDEISAPCGCAEPGRQQRSSKNSHQAKEHGCCCERVWPPWVEKSRSACPCAKQGAGRRSGNNAINVREGVVVRLQTKYIPLAPCPSYQWWPSVRPRIHGQ